MGSNEMIVGKVKDVYAAGTLNPTMMKMGVRAETISKERYDELVRDGAMKVIDIADVHLIDGGNSEARLVCVDMNDNSDCILPIVVSKGTKNKEYVDIKVEHHMYNKNLKLSEVYGENRKKWLEIYLERLLDDVAKGIQNNNVQKANSLMLSAIRKLEEAEREERESRGSNILGSLMGKNRALESSIAECTLGRTEDGQSSYYVRFTQQYGVKGKAAPSSYGFELDVERKDRSLREVIGTMIKILMDFRDNFDKLEEIKVEYHSGKYKKFNLVIYTQDKRITNEQIDRMKELGYKVVICAPSI